VRRCYICGRESSRRTIAEPLMLPVCLDRECGEIAAKLPPLHCGKRADNGHLCGATAVAQVQVEGRPLCVAHARAWWASQAA
jgi:hypothetical protein